MVPKHTKHVAFGALKMSSTCSPETAGRPDWKTVSATLSAVRSIDDASLLRHIVDSSPPGAQRGGGEDSATPSLCIPVDSRAAPSACFAHSVHVLNLGSNKKLVKKCFESESDMLADVRGLQLASNAIGRCPVCEHTPKQQLCAYDRQSMCLYFRHMGETAERLQQDSVPMSARIRCLLDACRQLRAMNTAGLGHFDVKPTNVLYHERTGRGSLIDFGSVRSFEEVADWYALDDTFRYTEKYFPRQKVKEGRYVTVRAAFVDLFGMALTCLDVIWPHARRDRGNALTTAHHFLKRLNTRDDVRFAMGLPRDPARVECANAVCRMLVEVPAKAADRRRFTAECRERAGESGTRSLLSCLLVLPPEKARREDGKRRLVHAAGEDDPVPAWDAAIGSFERALQHLGKQEKQ